MMAKCILIVSLLAGFCCAAQPKPEQIHIAMTGVPGEMVVSWATLVQSKIDPTVQYGLQEDSLTYNQTGESFEFVDGGSLRHTIYISNVKLTGLEVGTTYFYRVGNSQTWSDVLQFKTLPEGEIEIAIFGDMGLKNAMSIPLLEEELAAGAYDMVIHVGDFAYNLDTDNGKVGDEFMRMIQPVASSVPYMVCLGNHESAYNFSHYTNRFSGITGQESGSDTNWWFSYDVSYVHFVAISTEVYYHDELNVSLARQYEWLEQDLAQANANRTNVPWIVVYGHRPMYCSNVDDMPDCSTDAQQLRRGVNGQFSMEDLLAKYGVDIYFTAHEHSYERTWPVYLAESDDSQSNHTYTDAKWPTHIITGASGCPEDLDYYDEVFYGPWSVVRSASYGYGHLTIINASHLHWRQYLSENTSTTDELMLVKTRQGPRAELPVDTDKAPLCDHYCFAVCPSKESKEAAEVCAERCNCRQELASLGADSIGRDVRKEVAKVNRRA